MTTPAEMSVELDVAIKVGTLLGFFGGLGAIWWKFAQSIGRMEETLAELKEDNKQIVAILLKLAVYDEQIAGLRRELQELKHGHGFIKGAPIHVVP